jgi:exopolyphosphatase/guanosine-5'-triphosphate,3'-diphosphate pyrophosphatase
MILQHIFRLFAADEIVVSNYGVREGYLCKRIIAPQKKK